MAKIQITLPEDLTKRFENLGARTDEVMAKVLEAGGAVVKSIVAANLSASLGKGPYSRPAGKLASALGAAPPRLNHEGNLDTRVGFAENRSDGVSNAKLAGILEYGKHGQPPRPFMKPSKSKAKDPAIAAMVAAWEKEVKIN
jgi:hypothetical protein